MNSLGRRIEEKEHLVVKQSEVIDSLTTLFERSVTAQSGYGLSPTTRGTAIYVDWWHNGEQSRIEGYMIDEHATKEVQTLFSVCGCGACHKDCKQALFVGTLSHFWDCYFSNANLAMVKEWATQYNCILTIFA